MRGSWLAAHGLPSGHPLGPVRRRPRDAVWMRRRTGRQYPLARVRFVQKKETEIQQSNEPSGLVLAVLDCAVRVLFVTSEESLFGVESNRGS